MAKVLILGASGMLGQAMVRAFSGFEGQVFATYRNLRSTAPFPTQINIEFQVGDDLTQLLVENGFGSGDFVLNCIGLVKAHIVDSNQESRLRAIELNSLFPHAIADAVSKTGSRAISIATDCVFDGFDGGYLETSKHNAADVYGKTKSLGEVPNQNLMHIRASIIGRETSGFTSLFEWVNRQPADATLTGFTNHIWNGVGAIQFSKVCRAVIENNLFRAGVCHLPPADVVTKAQLVRLIAAHISRRDINFVDGLSDEDVDRSLSTIDPEFAAELWRAAGYSKVPTVAQLVAEI